jgi:hypothetical protein
VKKTTAPLIIEPHPHDYVGLPFLTLIQYRKVPMLTIVDNITDDVIRAYVLDLCGPEEVDEESIILAAAEWYQQSRNAFPVSIEFSRRGLTPSVSKIYRSLNAEFVSRVIGPVPMFPMNAVKSVKRRRRRPISPSVEVHAAKELSE